MRLNQYVTSFKIASKTKRYFVFLILFFGVTFYIAWQINQDASKKYQDLLSTITYDRNEIPIGVGPNSKSHYVYTTSSLPDEFAEILLAKEDRYFYYHPGINLFSHLRAVYRYVRSGKTGGSSTITEQLAKNLLQQESERNLKNKMTEMLYALCLEIFRSKDEILTMYANSIYLGNQIQGFETASLAYFNKPLSEITKSETMSLLATLSYPSSRNPWAKDNLYFAEQLSENILLTEKFTPPVVTDSYSFRNEALFEIDSLGIKCERDCYTTIDSQITKSVRDILQRHLKSNSGKNIKNGAIVIIDPKSSELLAIVGSSDPSRNEDGQQINMAIKPRPIGSTIKPFIYAEGFEAGLRPYSLVEDREYKYPIATGFSLYPKNYDGQYHGEVTLHEALSNSLNVPTVKTLEYVGLNNFYDFLLNDLEFKPIQDLDSYQYGIALGGLEMDLLTLTHYYTLLPRQGSIEPLYVLTDHTNHNIVPQSSIENQKEIWEQPYAELVHAIISDRFTGVNQFGLASNLNINYQNYGVKTGTSRDFHDSWVVGYTGDFVVGVWLGNSENTPLEQVSGATGAGAVWHDIMEYLLETEYHQNTPLVNRNISRFTIAENDEWGLPSDIISEHQNLLNADYLIISPHHEDVFEITPDLSIPLKSRLEADWSVNGKKIGTGQQINFRPKQSGRYEIKATDNQNGTTEIILITIKE